MTELDQSGSIGRCASNYVQDLTDRLESFYRVELGIQETIPLHEPSFSGREWAYVKEALDSGWVSSVGPFVDRFEQACAAATGAAEAVATVNGTAALHIALLSVGVKPGDLVVCPAISFVGTVNAIAHCGAEPAFVDVDSNLALCPRRLGSFLHEECTGSGESLRHRSTGQRVAAVIAVHVFGHPANMTQINVMASNFALTVVEDAAESIGSLYMGRECGALSRVGILSFNGNKTVTAGGGGAVVTNDVDLARRIKHLTTTARVANGFEFDHDEIAYNYRLPSLNAALACAQLERLEEFVRAKRALAERYRAIAGVRFLAEPVHVKSNYWLNAVLLDCKADRDLFLQATNERGIQTRPCWRPLPLLPMYQAAVRAEAGIARALDLASRTVNLPSGPKIAAALV